MDYILHNQVTEEGNVSLYKWFPTNEEEMREWEYYSLQPLKIKSSEQ